MARWGTIILFAAAAATTSAQWTVEPLDGFAARAIDAGGVVGETAEFHAVLWTGKGAVSLHPPGSTRSYAYAIDAGQQAGEYRGMFGIHAALWSGSAGTLVDLNPAGAARSVVNGMHSGRQTGFAILDDVQVAAHWTGTAVSFHSLNPPGASRSFAEAAFGNMQAGSAMFGGVYHAGYWTDTAESWTDLHPNEASESIVYGIDATRQVGFATLISDHAALWSGTPESMIDLHPLGTESSIAYGIFDSAQVGFATVGGLERAALWRGNAQSYVDLHSVLGPEFTQSYAYDVWKDSNAGTTYVAGRGWNGKDSIAMLWKLPPMEIPADTLIKITGTHDSGDLSSTHYSDDIRLIYKPGAVFSSGQPQVMLVFVGHAQHHPISQLKLWIESAASSPNILLQVEMYNYQASQYELVLQRPCALADELFQFSREDGENFASPNGEIKCRISYKALGAVFSYPWRGSIDWVRWRAVE
jgi:hypothetical protein